ncbi:amidase [Natronorubrum aibiense]|uniref:Amidase n=2 Tax=Natronorubrum aibiense TaxID=348826 RepID=A0A5P9P7Q1_9EURY|nr:amidase [Natronorubrum aibiense]
MLAGSTVPFSLSGEVGAKKGDRSDPQETAGDNEQIHNCFTSTITLTRQVRDGEVSPVELVDRYLERIDERDDDLNAFITLTPDRAREAAQEAEQAVENGEDLGPLHGVPFAIKDNQELSGVRYTGGSLAFEDRIAENTTHSVQQLLDAGAIPLGKTNLPEFGYMGKTDNLLVGPTSTPFDLERNAGGSSGGSAAAVADGLLPFATGTDGAGSIRIPASFTGTYGLKLTFRRIASPDGSPFRPGQTFFHHSVLTRTVAEAALVLSVMAGPSNRDPHTKPDDVDYIGALDQGVEGLSIAYSPDLGVFPVDERVRNVVGEAVETITEAGAEVEEVDVDLGLSYEELMETVAIKWDVSYATLADSFAEDPGIDMTGEDSDLFPDELLEIVEDGRELSGVDVVGNQNNRTAVLNGIASVFDEHDLLVTPTLAVPPIRNDELGPTEIEGVETDPIIGWLLTVVFNLTGNPAASVPAGLTDEGLPVGMQVVGPHLGDEQVIAASAAYEEVNPWFDEYPAFQ